MPLELFDYEQFTISCETPKLGSEFQHYFGGSAEQHGIRFVNAEHDCQIVYLLDTADPLVPLSLSNLRFLSLVHGFQYSSNGFEFIYRILNEKEIEVIAPAPLEFNKDFPYVDYPSHFERAGISFDKTVHQQHDAESALEYQGVFGIDQLSDSEMKRAVNIARSTWHPERFEDPDWSAEEAVRILGCDPFVQAKPSKSCKNPDCSADVDQIVEAFEIELPPETAGEATMQIDELVIRVPTLKVIAIHQPDDKDEIMWGNSLVQLIWQLCSECGCITVTNQCT